MRITCFNCKHTWQISTGQFLAARLKDRLGFKEHTFVCPNCDAKNVVTEHDFETTDGQIPVTGGDLEASVHTEHHPPRADNDGATAPINPVPAPDPASVRQVRAIVLERGIPLRREPSWNSETMATLQKGEEVILLDMWMNGDDVWAQLGPERWAAVIENGEALIDLIDDRIK
jgi:uncharacterized protein YlaI